MIQDTAWSPRFVASTTATAATSSDVNTGTDTNKFITPAALAGSSPSFGGNLTVSGTGTSSVAGPFGVGTNIANGYWGSGANTPAKGIFSYASTGTSINTADKGLVIYNSDTTTGNLSSLVFGTANAGASPVAIASVYSINADARIVGFQSGHLGFATVASGGILSEGMRLVSTGNVLIGTTTDGGQKLQVNGAGYFAGQLTALGISHTFGSGGTSTNNALITLNGSSASNYGAYLLLQRNSVNKWSIGTYSGIQGGASDDYLIYNQTASNEALRIAAATSNATFAGTVSVAKGAPQVKVSLDRNSSTDSSYVRYTTNGTQNWVVGTGVTGSDTNYAIYSYGGGGTALSLSYTDGNATFAGRIQAKGTVFLFGADSSQRFELTTDNGSSQGVLEWYNRGTSAYFAARYLASSHSFEQGPIAIANTVTAAVGVSSSHKVTISIGGVTYYLLATNV